MDVINTSFLWLCFDNLGWSTISFIMLLQNLEVIWLLDVGFGIIRSSSVHGIFSTSHSVAWKEASVGI